MLTVVTAVTLLALTGGGWQDPEPRLRARLDSATARAVEAIVDSARIRGLPTEPLIQKALEGRTKGAAGDRIVAAVGILLDGLGRSRQALGSAAGADELQAGALWFRAGGTAEQLGRLRHAAPGRSLAVPIAVSAELLTRGWPPDEATLLLERLFRARVSDAAFLSLRIGVHDALRGGASLVPAVRAEVARLAPGGNRVP
ncbi:MAG: hypothetical protein IT352_13575 [Gemmatimonadales bacterium]|nr:hypothetical protein [Gemmatimonadales bacterium]